VFAFESKIMAQGIGEGKELGRGLNVFQSSSSSCVSWSSGDGTGKRSPEKSRDSLDKGTKRERRLLAKALREGGSPREMALESVPQRILAMGSEKNN